MYERIRWTAIIVLVMALITACSGSGPADQPTSKSDFLTPDRATECLNNEVRTHEASKEPLTRANAEDQSISCFELGYTGAKSDAPCVGRSDEFRVDMTYVAYPGSAPCSGDSAEVQSATAYLAKPGETINLGPAECLALTNGGVTCRSNKAGGPQFTLTKSQFDVPIEAGDKVYVASGGFAGTAAYRPTPGFTFSGDSTFGLSKITWQTWTQAEATGTATLDENTCDPTCAVGKYVSTPVTMELSKPKLACGKFFFTDLTYQAAGDPKKDFPLGAPSSTDASLSDSCNVIQ